VTPAPRIVGLVFLVAAGCVGGENAPPRDPVVQPAAPTAARPTDQLASLEQRLRDTKAIGVFTKISLKNQVDDLLTQFRAFHQEGAGVLTALREKYSLLLLKVFVSLARAGDPALARAVAASAKRSGASSRIRPGLQRSNLTGGWALSVAMTMLSAGSSLAADDVSVLKDRRL
jgi:hypothetical protein